MLVLIEFGEFVRALNFPGSDIFIALSAFLVCVLVSRIKIKRYLWCVYAFLIIVPVLYSYTSKRPELAMVGFSIATFFFLSHSSNSFLLSFRKRFFLFSVIVLLSYMSLAGEPIYSGSTFNSLFFSGNAFINYLLLSACILAFNTRSFLLPGLVSIPLLMIQTKSVVVLFISNSRFSVIVFLMALPFGWFLGSIMFERIAWMLQQRGLIYALGAGRVERLVSDVGEVFTLDRILIGSPFNKNTHNFEIEFVDILSDFGLIYTLVLYFCAFFTMRRLVRNSLYKILVVFLVLNLGGHFWNNTVVVVAFLSLIFYANSNSHKYVS